MVKLGFFVGWCRSMSTNGSVIGGVGFETRCSIRIGKVVGVRFDSGDVSMWVRCWAGGWVFVERCCKDFLPFLAFGFFLFLLRRMLDNTSVRQEGSFIRALLVVLQEVQKVMLGEHLLEHVFVI